MIYKLKGLWQRLTRGWDDSEAWNFNDTFLKWVVPRLKRLKEIEHGYINDTLLEAYNEINGTEYKDSFCIVGIDISDEVDELAFEKWQKILTEMIFGFEAAQQEMYNIDMNDKESHIVQALDKSFELFVKYFDKLWD